MKTKMLGFKYFFITIFGVSLGVVYGTAPRVTLNDGIVEGYILKTINQREIAAFEGVPYGEPPVNSLRFEPAQPKQPWVGVWKATTRHKCLQYPHYPNYPDGLGGTKYIVTGSEDCLYVNVYKPNEDLKNLDVIIYIHGGAFMYNYGGLYRPDYILDKDIVYITINYRLGPLGFLSLEDEVIPGNNGLKDQNLALKWIKNNIHHFGGNPNSITIVGMSAGGVSVHSHTLSPLSRGLFNKVISQSGVALNPWAITEKTREKAFQLGELVGCSSNNSKDLIACLKSRPGQQIVESVKHFQPFLYDPFTPFGAVVDKWSKNPFFPQHPFILLKNKDIADVPTMFTYVQCEGLYPALDFPHPKILEEINSNWNDIVPFILDYNNTVAEDKRDEVSKKIRDAYFGNKEVSMDTFDNLVDMVSDRIFTKNIYEVALKQSAAITSPVYSYKLSFLGSFGFTSIYGRHPKYNCTSHSDDTLYVIPELNNERMRSTERDAKMSDIFINMWISFAKTGHPVVDNVDWTTVSKSATKDLDYLHIVSPEEIKMVKESDVGRATFWNTLPFEENENLFSSEN